MGKARDAGGRRRCRASWVDLPHPPGGPGFHWRPQQKGKQSQHRVGGSPGQRPCHDQAERPADQTCPGAVGKTSGLAHQPGVCLDQNQQQAIGHHPRPAAQGSPTGQGRNVEEDVDDEPKHGEPHLKPDQPRRAVQAHHPVVLLTAGIDDQHQQDHQKQDEYPGGQHGMDPREPIQARADPPRQSVRCGAGSGMGAPPVVLWGGPFTGRAKGRVGGLEPGTCGLSGIPFLG